MQFTWRMHLYFHRFLIRFTFISVNIEAEPSASEGCSMSNDEEPKPETKKLLDVTELLQGKIIYRALL